MSISKLQLLIYQRTTTTTKKSLATDFYSTVLLKSQMFLWVLKNPFAQYTGVPFHRWNGINLSDTFNQYKQKITVLKL